MRFQAIVARLAFAIFAVALAIGVAAASGTRLGVWSYHFGFLKMFPWSVFLGLGALGLALIWVIVAMIRSNGDGAGYGVIALIGAIVLVFIPIDDVAMASGLPHIHDISTDIFHAPKFEALLPLRAHAETPAAYDGPDSVIDEGKLSTVRAEQKKYFSDIRAVEILEPPAKLYWHAFFAVKHLGWDMVAFDSKRMRIEVRKRTFFFGFTDDIVIRVRPAGIGARLDIRSKARDDTVDFGRQVDNIRDFYAAIRG